MTSPKKPQSVSQKFRFKNKLVSLDASVIDLSLSLFDWAHFRRTKGAVKLHLLLDHDGYLPSFAVVTTGKTSDIKVARRLRFERGTVVVMDRGYIDYEWFVELTRQTVYFVTRLKDTASFEVVENRSVPPGTNVRKDQIIFFHSQAIADREHFFRIVEVWDDEKQRSFVFLTNRSRSRHHDRGHLQRPLASRVVLRQLDIMHSFGSYCISRVNCAESTVGGVALLFRFAMNCSTFDLHRIHGAPGHACVAGSCFSRISRNTVVGVTPSKRATSLTAISPRACLSPSQ